jgi:hypothetical protein
MTLVVYFSSVMTSITTHVPPAHNASSSVNGNNCNSRDTIRHRRSQPLGGKSAQNQRVQRGHPRRRGAFLRPRISTFLASKTEVLKIVSFNIRSVKSNLVPLKNFLLKHKPHLVALQETWGAVDSIEDANYYVAAQKSREGRGGGVALLCRKDIVSVSKELPSSVRCGEVVSADIFIARKCFTVYNVYRPPRLNDFDFNSLDHGDNSDCVIVGDFNAHHELWGGVADRVGSQISDAISNKGYLLLNRPNGPATHYMSNGISKSQLDLAMVKSSSESWSYRVMGACGVSDHRPLMLESRVFSSPSHLLMHKFNFKKANIAEYQRKVESRIRAFSSDSLSVDVLDRLFRDACLSAAKASIPYSKLRHSRPVWSRELEAAESNVDDCVRRLSLNPSSPQLVAELRSLTQKLREATNSASIRQRAEFLQTFDFSADSKSAWRQVKRSLSGGNSKPLCFDCGGRKLVGDDAVSAISKDLRSIFAGKPLSNMRLEARRLRQNYFADRDKWAFACENFTVDDISSVIAEIPTDTAPGVDGFHAFLFKNLPRSALVWLCEFFNHVFVTGVTPLSWRQSLVRPIPKGESYRPISLITLPARLYDRLLNKKLQHCLEQNNFINFGQVGFRRGKQATDALTALTEFVAEGFEKSLSTLALALDLSKAYDRVRLLSVEVKLRQLNCPLLYINAVKSFILNRYFAVQERYGGRTSKWQRQPNGLPQGAALSCTLFILLIADLEPAVNRVSPGNCTILFLAYADDTLVAIQGAVGFDIVKTANRVSARMVSWFLSNGMVINCSKTEAMLFSLRKIDMPSIWVNGHKVVLATRLKYLGIWFDPVLSFKWHCDCVVAKAKKRIVMMRRLKGLSAATLKAIYGACVRTLFEYGSFAWFGALSRNYLKSMLDSVQQSAARVILGVPHFCHGNSVEFLAGLQPLTSRLHFLASKYLSKSLSNPCLVSFTHVSKAVAGNSRFKKIYSPSKSVIAIGQRISSLPDTELNEFVSSTIPADYSFTRYNSITASLSYHQKRVINAFRLGCFCINFNRSNCKLCGAVITDTQHHLLHLVARCAKLHHLRRGQVSQTLRQECISASANDIAIQRLIYGPAAVLSVISDFLLLIEKKWLSVV